LKALLDTHIWIWYLTGDGRLRSPHKKIILDPSADLWLSAISIWETYMLIERKRLLVNLPPDAWIQRALQALSVHEAPITFRIAARSRRMPLAHSDPADRFIAATSAEMDIPLLTADATLLACPDIHCR